MPRTAFCITAVLATVAAMPALANPSTFQLTCSEITFAYSSNFNAPPALNAVCLTIAGTPGDPTSLILTGISNQNGDLTQGTGPSSFQRTCGNIHFDVDIRNVTLSAFCRRINGTFEHTTLPLNNISNRNGVLTQP